MSGVGLVVTSYNRPGYLARTLHDLRRCTLPDTSIALVDDGSHHPLTRQLIARFAMRGVPVCRLFRARKPWAAVLGDVPVLKRFVQRDVHFTVHDALREAWDKLLQNDPAIQILVNIDADVLLHPQWLTRLRAIFERERKVRGPLILTGFHTTSHKVLAVHDDHLVKESIGGVNAMFDVETYQAVVRPNLNLHWDWNVVRYMQERQLPLLCTRPSLVQHIGARGRFSSWRHYDKAADFQR